MIQGFFELQMPEDLLRKLRHDHEQMRTCPFDPYMAYNFFITAEAMVDWVYPGDKNKKKRISLRKSEWFLQAASDLAIAAKHFDLHAFHNTVDRVFVTAGWFPKNAFPKGSFPKGFMGDGAMMVCLLEGVEGEVKERFTAFAIATRVLEYWEKSIAIDELNHQDCSL